MQNILHMCKNTLKTTESQEMSTSPATPAARTTFAQRLTHAKIFVNLRRAYENLTRCKIVVCLMIC